ncbi:MAG: 6-carboxytetrahydropterin synthase [Flavobacteriales bacterium]|nr:6-carboxytetrahydropterin synthase [Flavobacteriales bacterium]
MVYITRRERFCAAHKLYNEEWTEDENLSIFGKCSNPNWHGHNYELYVTVKGVPDKQTGFVMNLSVLSKLIEEKILSKIDHKNLNLDVPFLSNIIPSTENLTITIWNELEKEIEKMGGKLHCIKLFETENNFAEYFGK